MHRAWIFKSCCLVLVYGLMLGAGSAAAGAPGSDTAALAEARTAAAERLSRDPLTEGIELLDPTIVEYQGEHVEGGGCRYTSREQIKPGDIPVGFEGLSREIAHDPAACVLTMQRGFVPAGTVLNDSSHDSEISAPGGEGEISPQRPGHRSDSAPTQAEPDHTGDAGSGGLTAPSQMMTPYNQTSAYLKTWYEDPVFIDVTSNLVAVDWRYGGCVGANPTYHWFNRGWFSETGWYEDEWQWWYGWDCSEAWTDGRGVYINPEFCERWVNPLEGSPTYVDHWQTYIEGHSNNTYWKYWEAYKWGGCHGLLHFGEAWGTPY